MKLPFDKVYMLHLAENENRLNFMVEQFKHHGISKQVEIWWTCKRDISVEIGNNLNSLHTDAYDWYKGNEKTKGVYGGVFNFAFEHYTIIKQAYLRGFESILIIEDDCEFIKDKKLFKDIFDNIPEDYDIIKYHNGVFYENDNDDNIINKYYNRCNFAKGNTTCYALKRRGMELVINQYNKCFEPSDIVLDKAMDYNSCKEVNSYAVNKLVNYVEGFISNIYYH